MAHSVDGNVTDIKSAASGEVVGGVRATAGHLAVGHVIGASRDANAGIVVVGNPLRGNLTTVDGIDGIIGSALSDKGIADSSGRAASLIGELSLSGWGRASFSHGSEGADHVGGGLVFQARNASDGGEEVGIASADNVAHSATS